MSEDRAPRIIEIDLTTRLPDLGQCQFTMKGRTQKRRGRYVTPWTRPCPNRAVVTVRGRHYCDAHRPSALKES